MIDDGKDDSVTSEAPEDGVSNDDSEYSRFFSEWLYARSEEFRIGVSTGAIDMRYRVRQKKKRGMNAKRLIRRLFSIYRDAAARAVRIEKAMANRKVLKRHRNYKEPSSHFR